MALLASVLMAEGCINHPGALQLKINCPHKIPSAQGIPVRLSLTCSKDAVCLWKGHYFGYQLEETSAAHPALKTGERFYCGTGFVVLLPVLPVVLLAGWLDVADLGARFDVLSSSGAKRETQILRLSNHEIMVITPDAPHSKRSVNDSDLESWPTGTYKLTATLVNAPGASQYGPPPLFWKPYDEPVTASTELEIVP